ncbi:MAG: hypothetical protein K2W95_07415 [Candidatus Obscuribacterales bacterium]|nr:hypothetical protein [Candidatus Obscuribacterales bacterium]
MGKLDKLALVLITVALSCQLPARSMSPRSQASDALRKAKRDTDKLVKDVASFLQMSGRWAPTPKGDDMQLCQLLQAFQQQVERLEKDNSSQRPLSMVQSDLQSLQFQMNSVEQMISRVAANPMVLSSWNSTRMDINTAAQYISPYVYGQSNLYDYDPASAANNANVNPYQPNPYQPNPYHPNPYQPNPFGGLTPSYSPYSSPINTSVSQSQVGRNVQSAVRNSESTLERMIQQTANYLQVAGKWPPQQGTPEMQLCQELQSFQQQLRRFGDSAAAQTPYPVLQTEVQQLSSSSGNIDRLLFQSGAPGEISARWNELRQQLNVVYQSFYSGGTPYFWTR